jgi:WD40 repeat protein/DNA-binding SARP family transcriptional activator
MEALRIFTFGGLRLCRGEAPLPAFETHKVEALLVYLACTRRPQLREHLAELLWEERTQQLAHTNLRVALASLRKQVGEYLLVDRESISLNPQATIWVDSIELENLLAASHSHRSVRTGEQAGQVIQAAQIYLGKFLDGFSLHEGRGFEEWMLRERQRLHHLVIDALENLVEYEFQTAQEQAGLEHAARLVELDELNEQAHYRMMDWLARSGRRGEALAQYDSLQRLLWQELGVAPTASTKVLYQKIRSGELQHRLGGEQVVRGYRIGAAVGSGRMGTVYRAKQEYLDRDVAVKVILAEYANRAEFVRRFESETQVVAQLEHPHIVPLYDYWRGPDGAFLVMRWMPGGSLEDRLRLGALPLDEAGKIFEQVGQALSAAHSRGVVHQNMKPANILLDGEGNAYLSDFGITRGMQEQAGTLGTFGFSGVSTPAYITPEQVQGGPVTPQTDIYALGLVLYVMLAGEHPFQGSTQAELLARHLRDPFPSLLEKQPDLPPGLDRVIQKATAKCAHERYPDVQAMLAAFQDAVEVSREAGRPALVGANPYKGLRAFEQADADDFYGREVLTKQLLARLGEAGEYSRFLALVGPSGCGKSSAVKAGLLPALRRGALPGSQDWYILEMAPHTHPLDELEIALMRVNTDPGVNLAEQLGRDERGLLRAVRMVLPAGQGQLLLVVDQFEELFTLVEDKGEARHFMDLLSAAVTEADSPLRLVVTLRADFYDRPLMEREFAGLLQKRTEAVVPLTVEELERAVRCPAEHAGAAFEEGLESEIVAEVLDEPGALPLLQYALTELYEHRSDSRLTHQAYQEIGGVRAALGRRAEEVFQGLDERQQALARQVFLRLVTLGEGVEDTRRRVLMTELEALEEEGPNPPAPFPSGNGEPKGLGRLADVLEAFGKARLVTFDHDPQTRGPTAEVAHEALLREWPRLKGWLEESRADIRLQRLLANGTAEWLGGGRDPSFLLRGARLAQFEEWARSSGIALTGEERAYLQASRQDESARLAREAALEKRWRAFLWGLVGVFALAAVISLGLTGLARRAQSQALAEADARATAEAVALEQRQAALLQASAGLAAQALAELDGNQPERAVLLALAALEEYPYTPQAESALSQAVLQVYPYLDLRLELGANPGPGIINMVFSPDDRQVIAYHSGFDTSWVLTIDPASSEVLRSFQLDADCGYGISGAGARLALSPDGKQVAIAHQNDPPCPFVIWDLETGEKVLALSDQPEVAAYYAAWSPDGHYILSGSLDGVARVWDASSGEVVRQLTGHNGAVWSVGWSPDGQRLATGNEAGAIRLWDAKTGEEISTIQGHVGPVLSLDWAPTGEFFASGGSDGMVYVWDAATGQVRGSLRGHTDLVRALAWSAAGDRLATSSPDGTTRVWNPLTSEQLLRLSSATNYQTLDWSSQGNGLLTFSVESERIWDLSPRISRLAGHTAGLYDAQWSPDGQRLATASWDDRTVRIWEWPGGRLLQTLDNPGYYLAWSPDGRRLAIANYSAEFSAWDTASWERLWELPGSTDDSLFALSWSPDGKRLAATGIPDFYAVVLDGESGQELTRIENDRTGWLFLRPQSWSPQGDRFVAGTIVFSSEVTPARVWDADSGKALLELPGQAGSTMMGAYSPDGRYIATLSGGLQVWDASSGQPVSPAVNFSKTAQDLHWSPDGKRIVTGSALGYVLVLDALSGSEVARYPVMRGVVTAVDWSPDGKSLVASLLTNAQPYIFPAWQTTEELIAYAKECCVWRKLSAEERAQFGLPEE